MIRYDNAYYQNKTPQSHIILYIWYCIMILYIITCVVSLRFVPVFIEKQELFLHNIGFYSFLKYSENESVRSCLPHNSYYNNLSKSRPNWSSNLHSPNWSSNLHSLFMRILLPKVGKRWCVLKILVSGFIVNGCSYISFLVKFSLWQ